MSEELETGNAVVEDGSTDSEGQNRQPQEQAGQGLDLSRVNLDDVPAFRKWKSESDKRIEAARQASLASEQRIAEMERAFHEQRMAGMDAQQRIEYENQLLRQQLAGEQQARRVLEFDRLRERDIAAVSKKLKIDPDELRDALPQGADAFVLWDTATELATKKASGQAPKDRPRQVSQRDNTVDLGGGPASGATNKYQAMYDKAVKDGDVLALIDAMAAAGQAGVTLRE